MAMTCCGDDDELHPRLRTPSSCFVVLWLWCLYAGICTTLSFHLSPTGLMLCAVQVLVAAMLASEHVERKLPAAQLLLILGGVVSASAAMMGVCNYHAHYAPYINMKGGRTYDDVTADSKASAYLDGGILHFNADAIVDETRSLGMKSHGFTYCVAPVLSRERAANFTGSLLPVQFWAVGTDCCSARSNFQCGSAGDTGAHGGLVMHEPEEMVTSELFAPRSHHDEFRQAAFAAAALHGMSVAEPPAFVRWETAPEKVLQSFLEAAIGWCVMTSCIVACLTCCCWCSVQSHYDGKIRQAALQFPGKYAKTGGYGAALQQNKQKDLVKTAQARVERANAALHSAWFPSTHQKEELADAQKALAKAEKPLLNDA